MGAPAADTLWPCPPVSDAPKPSITNIAGSRSTHASFTDGDSTAPPESTTVSGVTSGAGSRRSKASTSGRAKASPTITRNVTRSCSIRRQSRAGSRCRSGEMTTVPPEYSVPNAIQWAVPCMNGHAGRPRRWRSRESTISSGLVIGASPRFPPPNTPKKMSSARHITPFGMPVVPPV